jgi:outer membrane protein assembly factor BamB
MTKSKKKPQMTKHIFKRFPYLLTCLMLLPLSTACQQTYVPTPTPTIVPPTNTPPPPAGTVLWTIQTAGAIYSSPAVAEGMVYFGSDDGWLYAAEAGSGKVKWKFETQGLVRSRPALAEGTLYFVSDDGNLYALDVASGAETWRIDIGNDLLVRVLPVERQWDYLQSSPAVAEGVVYAGSADGNLYAVDAWTGKEKWQFATQARVRSSPAVAEGLVYVGSWDGHIYAVDTQTGQETWHFDTRGAYWPVQPSPTVVDGIVYCGSRNPWLYALDAKNGKQLWRYPYNGSWVESSATVVDGIVYVGSSDSQVLNALDAKTGALKWDFHGTAYFWSSPAFADGVVYIGGMYYSQPFFYAVNAQTGQEKWKLSTGKTLEKGSTLSGVVSSPAVADGLVFFGGLDGKLYAVSK